MNDLFRKSALPVILLALAGCATQGKPPPTISLDELVQAQPLPEPVAPVEVVAVPEVLPMPAQLKPLPGAEDAKPVPEPTDEKVRVLVPTLLMALRMSSVRTDKPSLPAATSLDA